MLQAAAVTVGCVNPRRRPDHLEQHVQARTNTRDALDAAATLRLFAFSRAGVGMLVRMRTQTSAVEEERALPYTLFEIIHVDSAMESSRHSHSIVLQGAFDLMRPGTETLAGAWLVTAPSRSKVRRISFTCVTSH